MEPENCALAAKFEKCGYMVYKAKYLFEHEVAKVPMREVGIMTFILKGLFLQNLTITWEKKISYDQMRFRSLEQLGGSLGTNAIGIY